MFAAFDHSRPEATARMQMHSFPYIRPMKTTEITPSKSAALQQSRLATQKENKTGTAQVTSVEQLDSLFSTLRTSKISMSACHAIIKLYMARKNKNESLILSTLANKIGITTAAITSVADCMESHGLAKRQQDPNDRRIVLISLTPKGMNFAESFGAAVKA
jgi:DNA-binding MarR family transcriptional regulator